MIQKKGSYEVLTTTNFENNVLYYQRKKKFTHIAKDITPVIDSLQKGQLLGDAIPGLTIDVNEMAYKVRVVNSNTQSGKQNGYRLIYYVIQDNKTVVLLALYYKKDDSRVISNTEIKTLINQVCA